jgi:DNA-binding response OmpR family regulator
MVATYRRFQFAERMRKFEELLDRKRGIQPPDGLTPIESALAVTLIAARGQWVTYDDLARSALDFDFNARTLVIRHIANIRIKLGHDVIENRQRLGYRWARQ